MTKKQKKVFRHKIAIICTIFLLIYLVAGYSMASKQLTPKEILQGAEEHIRKTNPKLLEEISAEDHSRPFEHVGALTAKKDNMVRIESRPQINSKKDLMDYKTNRLDLIDKLSKGDKNKEVRAIINFKKLMTREEYLDFVKEHNDKMELIGIRFRSSDQFNGGRSVSNEQPLPSKESIEYEEKFMEDIGLKNHKYLTHILTLKANIKAKDLKKIQNDPRVFLVDVGPLDIKEIYEPGNRVDMLWRYIFPEIEKYGG